jgi:hypothetical protein
MSGAFFADAARRDHDVLTPCSLLRYLSITYGTRIVM